MNIVLDGEVSLVIRALGPSLNDEGISDAVTDPYFDIYDKDGQSIDYNDDWQDGPSSEMVDLLGEAPSHNYEAAVMKTLSAGNYTVVVSTWDEGGVLALEVVNLDPDSVGKITFINTTGRVASSGTFSQSMSLHGALPVKFLGFGKGLDTLQDFGISDALTDPFLTLSKYQDESQSWSLLAENNDWEENYRAEEIETSPDSSAPGTKEAAIVADLSAGEYLWVARDVNQSASGFIDFTWVDFGQGDTSKGFAPLGLASVSELQVNENEPVGTFVGEFNATDPDGDSITYQLVSGNGYDSNDLFYLDENGTLRTATIFDFETNASTYSIRVQAEDPANASTQGTYIVTLTNQVEDLDGDGTEDYFDDDMDGDGFSNEEELAIGSDPRSAVGLALNDSNFHNAIALWFDAEVNATAIYGHISDWNTSAVTNMFSAFKELSSFNEDISGWDTSNVIDMGSMFYGATAFNQAIGNWNTSSVTVMSAMFSEAESFNQDLSDWNTSSVTTINRMFEYSSAFNGDITTWDTSAVQNMNAMFRYTDNFNQDLSDWNVSSMTNLYFGFEVRALSNLNKRAIHASFSSNENWDHNWGPAGANSAPIELGSLSVMSIVENSTTGTIVGEFNATDEELDAISFHLVEGEGAEHNYLFSMTVGGDLKVADLIDYEELGSLLSIRVEAKDEYNATIQEKFSISVVDIDDESPVIVLEGDENIVHQAGSLYEDARANWSDNVDGTGTISGSGEVNSYLPGIYSIAYNHTDAAGNIAQQVTRTVTVVDTTAPVISLNGDDYITLEAGDDYVDVGGYWVDIVDGEGNVTGVGEVDIYVPGVYTINFNHTDDANNAAFTVTRTVNVVDTTVPVITLNGDAKITHEAGDEYIDLNATWYDIVDGTGMVIAEGHENVSVPGEYLLTYDHTDEAGNAAETVIRTVNVVDTTRPVL